MKTNLMQLLRLVLMVLAVAGVIYAIVSGSWACSIRSA